ncbi:hypothetical protein JJB71_13515 [Clostridium perfringens]|uniref:hypothetical protein n=1 Tax=Clostridium perfringens TaxID=1502 RepID=UPI001ABB1EBF|nr:hypothetical protein [Clostridium perfringens]MBO3398557.1 hypothetical protein [Clostridium perfringens]
MVYCPNCGSSDVKMTGGFNLYDGGDYTCYSCEIEFYFGITNRDIFSKKECNYCKRDFKEEDLQPITLYGTHDFYNLEVCEECYKNLECLNDESSEVDNIINNI